MSTLSTLSARPSFLSLYRGTFGSFSAVASSGSDREACPLLVASGSSAACTVRPSDLFRVDPCSSSLSVPEHRQRFPWSCTLPPAHLPRLRPLFYSVPFMPFIPPFASDREACAPSALSVGCFRASFPLRNKICLYLLPFRFLAFSWLCGRF